MQAEISLNAKASLTIREILITDAEAASALSGELGYPVSAEVMQQRIRHLAAAPNRAVFVACLADTVAGWIDLGVTHHLQAEPAMEIGGLVVSSSVRGAGIGRKLLQHAEKFAAAQGLKKMVVRSRITREAAHRFYLREGYEMTKTSAVFSKTLG